MSRFFPFPVQGPDTSAAVRTGTGLLRLRLSFVPTGALCGAAPRMALRAGVSDCWCNHNASVPPQALWWAPYSPLPVGALAFFVHFHQDLGEYMRRAVGTLSKVEPPNEVSGKGGNKEKSKNQHEGWGLERTHL